ncbi:MAG: hypothetical protein HY842_14990 [Bacteroidetes bacterium]|nr:hypothetical protein [Bacteroidota bacterium]
METLLIKYESLDQFSQKLVLDFVDLLLKRQNPKPSASSPKLRPRDKRKSSGLAVGDNQAEPGNTPFDYQAYRKQLLALRPWSIEEVKEFDENLAAFKNMTFKEW